MKTSYAVLGLYLCGIVGAYAIPTTQTSRASSVRAGALPSVQTLPRKNTDGSTVSAVARSATTTPTVKKTNQTESVSVAEETRIGIPLNNNKGINRKQVPVPNQQLGDSKTVQELQQAVATLNSQLESARAQLVAIQSELETKANQADVNNTAEDLDDMQDIITQIGTDINSKASASDLTELNNRIATQETALEWKADKSTVNNLATTISAKADANDLSNLSVIVSAQAAAIEGKADTSTVNSALANKADNTEFQTVKNAVLDANNDSKVYTKTEVDNAITNAQFNPSSDTTITDLATRLATIETAVSGLDTKYDNKYAPKINNYLTANSVELQNINDALTTKTAQITSITDALATKVNSSDLTTQMQTLSTAIATKANAAEVFTKTEVNDALSTQAATLNTALNAKANAADVFTKTEVNNTVNSLISRIGVLEASVNVGEEDEPIDTNPDMGGGSGGGTSAPI